MMILLEDFEKLKTSMEYLCSQAQQGLFDNKTLEAVWMVSSAVYRGLHRYKLQVETSHCGVDWDDKKWHLIHEIQQMFLMIDIQRAKVKEIEGVEENEKE